LTRQVLSKKSSELKSWMTKLSDDVLHEAFMNLGGHDLESLVESFQRAKAQPERPTLIVAYTIKGYRLRCQALSGNHSALPEPEELKEMAKNIGATENVFGEFPEESEESAYLAVRRAYLVEGIAKIRRTVAERKKQWIETASAFPWPTDLAITAIKFNPVAHTQWMWGQIAAKLDRLARGAQKEGATPSPDDETWKKVAPYFLTMAPDVGSSTNTSPNMNGKLYGDIEQEDYEEVYHVKDTKAPDVIPNMSERTGHIRFEIAEGNCMSAAGSFGKFFHFTGVPFFPSMTIYDFFIKRAHDQFYYNLYWRSSFATIGTPSGVTLSSEGAQHSWKSDFQIPHCVTWEPCFTKELEWIFADMLRRHFTKEDSDREATLIRCVTKGLVQKEFLERLKTQRRFSDTDEKEIWTQVREEVLQGAYALIDYRGYDDYTPGDNVVHLFAMGALGAEAIKASDQLKEKGIFANVFIVTSPDLLLGNFAHEDNYRYLREGLGVTGDLYLNAGKTGEIKSKGDWFALQGNRVPIVSVHDGEPGILDNLGSIVGVKQKALAIRKTSKSGTTADIFHFHHIDAEAIVAEVNSLLTETAAENFQVNPTVLSQLLS
jgi:pyruvate dehydrogenase E1 component